MSALRKSEPCELQAEIDRLNRREKRIVENIRSMIHYHTVWFQDGERRTAEIILDYFNHEDD